MYIYIQYHSISWPLAIILQSSLFVPHRSPGPRDSEPTRSRAATQNPHPWQPVIGVSSCYFPLIMAEGPDNLRGQPKKTCKNLSFCLKFLRRSIAFLRGKDAPYFRKWSKHSLEEMQPVLDQLYRRLSPKCHPPRNKASMRLYREGLIILE